METYKYTLFKGRWGISILIYGQIINKEYFNENCIKVNNGIWLSFTSNPLVNNEIFCAEDRDLIFRGISKVSDNILLSSKFYNNMVIQICSLQYSLCHYQEEAMIVAMMNWCSKVFNFNLKEIEIIFDYAKNKYVFKI